MKHNIYKHIWIRDTFVVYYNIAHIISQLRQTQSESSEILKLGVGMSFSQEFAKARLFAGFKPMHKRPVL